MKKTLTKKEKFFKEFTTLERMQVYCIVAITGLISLSIALGTIYLISVGIAELTGNIVISGLNKLVGAMFKGWTLV